MASGKQVIFIPGLNDRNPINRKLLGLLPRLWSKYFKVHIFFPEWENGKSLSPKLKMLTGTIDSLLGQRLNVTLIGQSAGGSLAISAFSLRKKYLTGAVNITGRLGEGMGLQPSLIWAGRKSPAFIKSVLYCEKKAIPSLTRIDRKRILTIRPIFDEVVPTETVSVRGATNRVFPFFGHLAGVPICVFYTGEIFRFIDNLKAPSNGFLHW